jgi:hypothetical protein
MIIEDRRENRSLRQAARYVVKQWLIYNTDDIYILTKDVILWKIVNIEHIKYLYKKLPNEATRKTFIYENALSYSQEYDSDVLAIPTYSSKPEHILYVVKTNLYFEPKSFRNPYAAPSRIFRKQR